jgi:ATP-dependent DNA helicase RecG
VVSVEVSTYHPGGFAGTEPPGRWPPPRSAPRPAALAAELASLPGVGPSLRRKLARLGLETLGDVLVHRPRRYERPVAEATIAELAGTGEAVLDVVVAKASGRRRGRAHILTAHVRDHTGSLRATWFNQPWLEARLTPGTRVRIRGKANRFGFAVESYDIGEPSQTVDFAPVYPATADLSQKHLRTLAETALTCVRAGGDPLPASLRALARLPQRADALSAIHRPDSLEEAELGRRRLAFEELLVLQLALRRRAGEREALLASALEPAGSLAAR